MTAVVEARPCWWCGAGLLPDEDELCCEHDDVAVRPAIDPLRPDLLRGIDAELVDLMAGAIIDQHTGIVADASAAWGAEHLEPAAAEEFSTRAATRCRERLRVVTTMQAGWLVAQRSAAKKARRW